MGEDRSIQLTLRELDPKTEMATVVKALSEYQFPGLERALELFGRRLYWMVSDDDTNPQMVFTCQAPRAQGNVPIPCCKTTPDGVELGAYVDLAPMKREVIDPGNDSKGVKPGKDGKDSKGGIGVKVFLDLRQIWCVDWISGHIMPATDPRLALGVDWDASNL